MQWEFGYTIVFRLIKLQKAKLFMLCDVILLVSLQDKFELDHSWEWEGSSVCLSFPY